MNTDSFVPTEMERPAPVKVPSPAPARTNLAEDTELVKKVMDYLAPVLEKFKSDRSEIEDLWELGDMMYQCGQNQTLVDTERTRVNRVSDDMNQTNSQKVGSTIFRRQVNTLAALFYRILTSAKDPYLFKPRSNPELFFSGEQADELANQHNLLMRWTRDQDGFRKKSIELFTELLTCSDVPVGVRWHRKSSEIYDRWPVLDENGKVIKTRVGRRKGVLVENRPSFFMIEPSRFYCDQNIGEIQQQQALFIESFANITDLLDGERLKEFKNVDKVDGKHQYKGSEDESDLRESKETNLGYSSTTSNSSTGLYRQWDCHCLLPIDPDKPEGEGRWDEKKHEPKRYWVTVINRFDANDGVCLRLERNPDPDDEYPFEMIHLTPKKVEKMYRGGLVEALRGNYIESCVAKAQAIDAKSLNNNRPLKAINGQVHAAASDLKFRKDNVIWMDSPNALTEFTLAPVYDNMETLSYLEADSDKTAGTNKAVRGEEMGSRTSSLEASNAYNSSMLPHKMTIQYVFEQYLGFQARKGVRYWHVYADDSQILKITDEKDVYSHVVPADLWGDFDLEIKIVDDFEENLFSNQNMAFVMNSILPYVADVLDKRQLAPLLMQKFTNLDVAKMVLPDKSYASRALARHENQLFLQGQSLDPTQDEDYDAMLAEHKGFRLQFEGAEEQYPEVIKNLDAHIAKTEFLAEQAKQRKAAMAPAAGPQMNQGAGEEQGNQIAAAMGAMVQ